MKVQAQKVLEKQGDFAIPSLMNPLALERGLEHSSCRFVRSDLL